jgi:hypothetical protein
VVKVTPYKLVSEQDTVLRHVDYVPALSMFQYWAKRFCYGYKFVFIIFFWHQPKTQTRVSGTIMDGAAPKLIVIRHRSVFVSIAYLSFILMLFTMELAWIKEQNS